MRYGLLIKSDQCIGCYNCFLTCQDEFCGNAYEGYAAAAPMAGHNWMRVLDVERGSYPRVKVTYIPKPCMHCDDARCIQAAENGAVYRRADGIVVIDPVKAVGQKQLVNACPYRVIEWNEQAQVAQKCNLCAHALDRGEKEPRCVESCPNGAIVFGDLDDPTSAIAKQMKQGCAEPLRAEFNMKEKVLYTGLPKHFLAGTVVLKDKCEVATDAEVELCDDRESRKTRTNAFGDFEFEGLESGRAYSLKISRPGYSQATLRCSTAADAHVGDIYLAPQS